jgi:dihydrolipoamide dehydrogenase
VPNIYAAGDCTTFVPLASVASMQGRTAIFHALGDTVIPLERRRITANIFTAPEIATVGRQEKDLETGAINGYVYKLPLAANARAKMMGITDGFVKIIAREGGHRHRRRDRRPARLRAHLPDRDRRRASAHRRSGLARVRRVPSLSASITDATRAMHLVNRDDDFFG